MIFISHRGNLTGKGGDEWENHPDYITEALRQGFNVEIDVWFKNGELFLGHDTPKYKIDSRFLINNRLWCHAKNEEALEIMLSLGNHCFWHETDKYTLTSKGYIWCYPGSIPLNGSIILEWGSTLSDINRENIRNVSGFCSDNILNLKKNYEKEFIISNL